MTNLRPLLLQYAILVWRRKWLAIAVCWSVCIVGWGAVTQMPRRYESNARVFVDVNGLLTPLLKGLVVDTTPSQSTEYLRQTLLSRPNLEKVIGIAELAPPSSSDRHIATLVAELQKDIVVDSRDKNLISISFENADPRTAQNVVQALLTIFAETASSSNRVEMEKARQFLDSQIAGYEKQLRAAEQRRADFNEQYSDYMPDSPTGVSWLQGLQQQISLYQRQYDDAVESSAALRTQMGQVPQLLSVDSAPAVSANGNLVAASPEVRLAEAQHNLADLRLQYTDHHPDVVSAQRMVSDLQSQVESDNKSGGASTGKTQISNPTYEQLRLKLIDAETAIPAAKKRLDDAQVQLAHIKSLGARLPEIEAKAKDLDRDYDALKKNYDELVQRREAAILSQAADDQADRTQFRIIDPPQVPFTPAFPNLPIMFSLVFVVALGAGIAGPIILAQLRPTFASVSQLKELGLPVIGSVAFVNRGTGRLTIFRGPGLIAATGALLVCVYSVLMLVSTGAYRAVL